MIENGILTMNSSEWKTLALQEEDRVHCGDCAHAFALYGMDDFGFDLEPFPEHVYCDVYDAEVIDSHKVCVEFSEREG